MGLRSRTGTDIWKYGLIGGLVAMPLTIGDYLLFGSGDFPLTMVFFGGLVAGYLATQNAVSDYRAGCVAGIVGSFPGVFLFLPTLADTFTQWLSDGGVLSTLIAVGIVGAVIFGVAALLGLIGGSAGGWIATKVHSETAAAPVA